MAHYYPELAARVARQAEELPELYGDFDFEATPERFTTDPDDRSALPSRLGDRAKYLDNPRLMELVHTATFLADVPADRVAALSSRYPVSELIDLVRRVCRERADNVPEAPSEIGELIELMQQKPDWIDYDMIEDGAAYTRTYAALVSPFMTRGAFLATFTNSYAALPMTLTGALSGTRAARRVNETTAYFAVTALPGGLDRFSPGFEATVMVRLMHSTVRYNALQRSRGNSRRRTWDTAVFGLPVPQIDQFPAGMIGPYQKSEKAVRAGRELPYDERAMVEFHRYRAHMLGLPEELLPGTAQDIVDLFNARAATLKYGFDDSCRKLVTSTMDAYLRPSDSAYDKAADAVEKSYSKLAFAAAFCEGDLRRAADMGVHLSPLDVARAAATAPFLTSRFAAVRIAGKLPVLDGFADRYVTDLVRRRLDDYAIPEYTTDSREYAH
ncbi:oxygenase MpaB family protein [Gordonia paraffinivorans]|uniref:oxygenase MpaB family protein n=1 Tax=Gordonia paraffinivorans TaxID=175628 RepID=UPI0014485D97|nr:oxygenase MpaB family protein [Gordonia paraffinivorans]